MISSYIIYYSFIFLDMKSQTTLVQTSTMKVADMYGIDHISAVSPNKLWVSNGSKLVQVDDTGHVIRTLDGEYKFRTYSGCHTVSVEGDLVFIAKFPIRVQRTSVGFQKYMYGIYKMTPDGNTTTLLTPDVFPWCIHSSQINGDLLIGLIDVDLARVMRCDRTGRKKADIGLDEKGRRLYKCPEYITENKMNGDIVVSDQMKPALVVVDRSGRHRFDYKGHSTDESFRPHGVCTDVLGRILLSHEGFYNYDRFKIISLLDKDGRFLTQFLREQSDYTSPSLSICVDDKNNIYIALGDLIKVFRYD